MINWVQFYCHHQSTGSADTLPDQSPLASNMHSTLREHRITRSNTLLSGAPFSNKREYSGRRIIQALCCGPGQDGLGASDPDFVVPDADLPHGQPESTGRHAPAVSKDDVGDVAIDPPMVLFAKLGR
jgi:hypothetical protein